MIILDTTDLSDKEIGLLERCMDFACHRAEVRDMYIMLMMTRNHIEGRKHMRNQWIISQAMSIDEVFNRSKEAS